MKKIIYSLISLLASFGFLVNVNAASGSVSAYTPSSTATVGSTFTVTVTVSCSDTLGSWQYSLSYDSDYISLIGDESSSTVIADFGNGSDSVRYYTYKFRAISSGTAWININGASMVSWDDMDTLFTPSTSGDYIVVKTQEEIEASYSGDNNLSDLSVTGYELTPKFDMTTTEYKLEVPEDVKSVEVSASLNDWTARVSGTGSIDVSAGSNKIDVVVTAQNGSTKTYTINLTVKDINPINVTVDGKKYTVVKMANLLTSPTGFIPDTIKINNIEVPVFKSKLLNITLVGLKNESGKIDLYIYDEAKKTYSKYNEVKASSLILFPVLSSETPSGFTKSKITINNQEYDGFVSDISSDYVLIYAKNIEDGKEDFYTYDKATNSFIKYNPEIYSSLLNENKEYKMYMLASCALAVIFFLISIVEAHKNSKMKKAIKKVISSVDVTKETAVEENQKVVSESEKNEEDMTIDKTSETENLDTSNQDFSDLQPKRKKKKKKK